MAAPEDLIVLDRGQGTCVKVHLFGATVISWKIEGEEQIFVSSKSQFDNKKAIRGGIPIVFPNFGPWELGPQHGFARISKWAISAPPHKDTNNNVSCSFALEDNEDTRKMWNYKFKLIYTLTLKENCLETEFNVENKSGDEMKFTCLLHTYIKVPDVTQVTISGLKGCLYIDKVRNATMEELRDEVIINENVDSIYENTAADNLITNTEGSHSMVVSKKNFPDTVVWNPWAEKAAEMADFGDDEYKNMICVEAGRVTAPMSLPAGATYTASQVLSRL